MKPRFRVRWATVFLMLIVFAASLPFGIVGQTVFARSSSVSLQDPPYNPVVGQAIVSQAEQLAVGESPWLKGCVPNTGGLHCIPYSWGAGHGTQPGPSDGICQTWPKPPGSPKNLLDGPNCKASRKYPLGYGDNGTFGLDCSGFTRWVYALVYQKDVLGSGPNESQKTRPSIRKVSKGNQKPGDLVFFPGHVGIYIGKSNGKDMMIDAPHTYDKPTKSNPGWVQAYVRVDKVAKNVSYYRSVLSPTIQPLPQLASSYQGMAHNITYNIDANLALSSITEDQQGNIRGQMTVNPPLYGSGPFIGTVSATNAITFTSTATADGGTITWTGIVNGSSLSGTYAVDNGQRGSWQVSATS